MVCVNDAVELAVDSWVEPLVHVTVTSFRLEEHMRGTLFPSSGDDVPLGDRVGGLNTGDKKCEYNYYHIHTYIHTNKQINTLVAHT